MKSLVHLFRIISAGIATGAFLLPVERIAAASRQPTAQESASVGMATGFKIVEVSADTATIWMRLTKNAERNLTGPDFDKDDDALPEGRQIGDMLYSAVGAEGEVRVLYQESGASHRSRQTWQAVDPEADFTLTRTLQGLKPGTTYELTVEGRGPAGGDAEVRLTGSFQTAPAADEVAPVSFTVVTGQDDDRRDDPVNGHRIYQHMLRLNPNFFVHTGDVVYYDKATPWAKDEVLARYKWQATYSLPFQRDFHRHVASFFIRDDHDTTRDDSWPGRDYGNLTWERGLEIFEEQTAVPEKGYRTVRFGRDLQVWMMEGRKYRSSNRMQNGPDKTIWGEEQKQWFFDTVKESDATFRVLISPTPVVGPDRKNKNDNHANSGFQHEGDQVRDFIASQQNMFVVCGDRHWQYVSVDERTGVTEYSCGPTSNEHAGGWKDEYLSPMHKYLKVQGGFLHVTSERLDDSPRLVFRHYDVDGEVRNEDVQIAK